MSKRLAYIISVNDPLEHNFTLYNKAIFVGETITVIDSNPQWDACVFDMAVQKISLSSLISALLQRPDLVLLYLEVNQVRMGYRIAEFTKRILPDCKIFVYGRATTFIPHYFYRQPFDAIHVSGDREAAIADYLHFLDGNIDTDALSGVAIIDSEGNPTITRPGRWLKPSEWPLPSVLKLPMNDYLTFRNGNKSVVDSPLELAITATKGCPTKCNFCGCSEEEGLTDRTRRPDVIIEWAEQYGGGKPGTVHLHSPNILMKPVWVQRFSQTYHELGATFQWQGVTMTHTINASTLPFAAGAGCRKLSIGIEHINSKLSKPLKSSMQQLEIAADLCNTHGVDLVGLLMLGHPGQTIDDVRFILDLLHRLNIKNYRFTGYSPLHALRELSVEDLDSTMLEAYDRRTFYMENRCEISPYQFYDILVTNGACLE